MEIQSVSTDEIYSCLSKDYMSLIHGQWSGFKGNWVRSLCSGGGRELGLTWNQWFLFKSVNQAGHSPAA